jgi:MFS family permease
LALSDGEIGAVLLVLAAGAILGMILVGYRPSLFTARRTMVVTGLVFAACVGLLPAASDRTMLGAGAALMGLTQALVDVAANVRATAVNHATRFPILSSIHSLFYVGVLAGSAAMAAGSTLEGSVIPTGLAALVAMAMVAGGLAPNILAEAPERRPALRLPNRPVLRIGVLILGAFFLEGAMLDWGTIHLSSVDPGQDLPAWGFATFAAGMAAGRLAGDRLSVRLGDVLLVRGSALVAGMGLFLAVLIPAPVISIVAFGVVGIGLANIVPQLFAAAARVPDMPAATSIAMVSVLGYLGALCGPAAIGPIADHLGLQVALGAVALVALTMAIVPRSALP